MSVRRILVLPDIHAPYHDAKAIGAILHYASTQHVDELVQLGDYVDADAVNGHDEGKRRTQEGRRLKDEYDVANELLDQITDAVRVKNSGAKLVMLKGNHEWRVDRWVDRHPEVEGLVEVEHALRLSQRGVKWVESYPHGELHQMGKLYAAHGAYTNKYHSTKHLDEYGINLIYGHVHSIQLSSKPVFGLSHKTVEAISIGCLCNYDLPYIQGRPTKWQHAFAEVHVWGDGSFNVLPVRIHGGEFVAPTGEKFSYKERKPRIETAAARLRARRPVPTLIDLDGPATSLEPPASAVATLPPQRPRTSRPPLRAADGRFASRPAAVSARDAARSGASTDRRRRKP
jgi:predicted phosphodiesterase